MSCGSPTRSRARTGTRMRSMCSTRTARCSPQAFPSLQETSATASRAGRSTRPTRTATRSRCRAGRAASTSRTSAPTTATPTPARARSRTRVAPSQVLFIGPSMSSNDFTMHYTGTVPASGTLNATFVYSSDFTTAAVRAEARAAEDKLTPCTVPKLAGKTLAAAKTALTKAHCALGKVTEKALPRRRERPGDLEQPQAGHGRPQRRQGRPHDQPRMTTSFTPPTSSRPSPAGASRARVLPRRSAVRARATARSRERPDRR